MEEKTDKSKERGSDVSDTKNRKQTRQVEEYVVIKQLKFCIHPCRYKQLPFIILPFYRLGTQCSSRFIVQHIGISIISNFMLMSSSQSSVNLVS